MNDTLSALRPFLGKLERSAALSEADRNAVLSLPYAVRWVPAGFTLAGEGQVENTCFVVLSGMVGRYKALPHGSRQIVSLHIRGDAVDLDKAAASRLQHSVQALTRTEVASVSAEAIEDLMMARPAVAKAIWRDLVLDASIQREWTLNVGRRSARTRIAHVLCELGARMRAAGIARADFFDVPLTQEQLADVTGLTTVHVNRTLQALRADRLLEGRNRPLRVTDQSGLEAAGQFDANYLSVAA